nr:putative centromere protein [Ipomoea batatas]
MDTVHEKLDEAMAEIQKLRADYKINAESSENFKRAYNKRLIKIRDASSNVDKLTLELSMKEDELSVGKQAYEELKSNLKDKEAAIKSLSSANGRLRADYAEKLKKFEEENRSMAKARAREPYRELMAFLKELQEAGINDAGHSSLPKLINKLKGLEQVHGECSAHLKVKESEWVSQLEVLDLALQNEETSLVLLVLRSHLAEKNSDLVKAEKDVEDEREKVAMLLSRVESLNLIEEQQLPLQIEEDVLLKEMLKEASTYQVHLKEQVLKTKSSELKETKDTLDRADEELAESFTREKLQSSLNEDMKLTNELGRIMQTCGGFGLDMKRVNKFFDPAKENLNWLNIRSSSTKNVEAATVQDRLQFRELPTTNWMLLGLQELFLFSFSSYILQE